MSQLEHIEAIETRLWSAADNLRGILPKSEYQELENDVATHPQPRGAEKRQRGFGRIYEYFLAQFADQKVHDGGEFFTPFRWSRSLPMCSTLSVAPCWIRPVAPETSMFETPYD